MATHSRFWLVIEQAGTRPQGTRDAIRLNRPIEVGSPSASAKLLPAERAEFAFEIEFPTAVIGRQEFFCPVRSRNIPPGDRTREDLWFPQGG
jgi:UDP-3-O-acyl-N-acetylglucosamine deacetylase